MGSSERFFDVYIAVDWSAKNSPSSAKPSKDAIWVGEKDIVDGLQKETYFRTRLDCCCDEGRVLGSGYSKVYKGLLL